MNKANIKYMKKLIHALPAHNTPQTVLDVGSYDVNGSFKETIPEAWTYIGLDRVDGPNVDRLVDDLYTFPIKDNSVDLVVSSDTFQYVRNPFKMMESIHKCLKPGGTVIICANHVAREGIMGLPAELSPNRDEQYDCWRIFKDGMTALLEDSQFKVERVFYQNTACWGIGRKT